MIFNKNNRLLLTIYLFIIITTIFKCLNTLFNFDKEATIVDSLLSQFQTQRKQYHNGAIIGEKERAILEKVRLRIDHKYCGGPCKFVNMLQVVEQETRSQLHLRHFAFTSGLINRTIVLPNVASSRIGACQAYDFEYYYDIKWAKDNAEFFNYITMRDFKAWLDERKIFGVPASDQVMSISNGISHPRPVHIEQQKHCLSEFTRPKSSFNQVMAWNVHDHFATTGEAQLINFLSGGEAYDNSDVDILHISLNRGNAFSHNPAANVPISYSPELIQLADKAANQLGPFIAVHWRMETIRRSENLFYCAENLVSTLKGDPQFQDHKVFLLTDYPHSFTEEQQELAIEGVADREDLLQWVQSTSDTFHLASFTSNHHRAIKYLYLNHPFTLFETKKTSRLQEEQEIKNWELLPIPEHLQKASLRGQGTLIDGGWLGILDKLMAIRSEYFFAGKGGFCARKSTFTTQIIDERKLSHKADVQYFGY